MKIKKKDISREVGGRMTMVRKQMGYSRPDMAKRLGITSNSLGKNESGDSFPNTQTLHSLASDFDISMDWLLFEKGPMYHKEKRSIEEPEQQLAVYEKEKPLASKEKETVSIPVLAPDVRDLVEQMATIPLLHHEIMAHFFRFKMENNDLFDEVSS